VFKKQTFSRVIFALIAVAVVLSAVAESFAACGGYCEARQTLAACHRAVTNDDLPKHERDDEFEKCKSDPFAYRAPTFEGAAQFSMD
jgi:hypothetical protein